MALNRGWMRAQFGQKKREGHGKIHKTKKGCKEDGQRGNLYST